MRIGKSGKELGLSVILDIAHFAYSCAIAGEAVVAETGEWVRYSTPDEPAEYIAVCTPAFSPERANRDS